MADTEGKRMTADVCLIWHLARDAGADAALSLPEVYDGVPLAPAVAMLVKSPCL